VVPSVQMPGMDGFGATRAIRKLEAEARGSPGGASAMSREAEAQRGAVEPGGAHQGGADDIPIVALTADVMVRHLCDSGCGVLEKYCWQHSSC
jgi:CheY-like chemotaxis protein